jgi:hypothetical protein
LSYGDLNSKVADLNVIKLKKCFGGYYKLIEERSVSIKQIKQSSISVKLEKQTASVEVKNR